MQAHAAANKPSPPTSASITWPKDRTPNWMPQRSRCSSCAGKAHAWRNWKRPPTIFLIVALSLSLMLSRSASARHAKTHTNKYSGNRHICVWMQFQYSQSLVFTPSANLPVETCVQTARLFSGWSCNREVIRLMVASEVETMASVARKQVFKISGIRFAQGLRSTSSTPRFTPLPERGLVVKLAAMFKGPPTHGSNRAGGKVENVFVGALRRPTQTTANNLVAKTPCTTVCLHYHAMITNDRSRLRSTCCHNATDIFMHLSNRTAFVVFSLSPTMATRYQCHRLSKPIYAMQSDNPGVLSGVRCLRRFV